MTEAVPPSAQTSSLRGSGVAPARDGLSQAGVRLTWLMLFRAVVVAALLVSTVAIRLGTGEDLFGPGYVVVYAACATSYAAILAGALWLRRPWSAARGSAKRREQRVLLVAHLQLLWDAVFATLLTVSAGGVGSAFAFLYFLTVLVAASLVGRRGVLVVAAECALLYGAVFVAELMGLLHRFGAPARPAVEDLALPFLTNVLGMLLIAILAGYLTEQLRKTSESLSATRAHLYHLEELYAAVLASLPSGVLTVDDRGVILYVNAAGAHILGTPAQKLVGQHIDSVANELPTRSDDGPVERERFEISLASREGRGQGEARILGGSVAKLTGVEALAGSVVVFQDLTELRRLQRDVARADRLATIGRFAAGLAHEIRNPLAAMIGCLELLQADLLRPSNERGTEGAQMLGIVQREAERLSNLVTAFLTYARPLPPDSVRTDMARLVEETARTAQVGAPRATVEVTASARPHAPVDPEQVRQVLWNLIGNAIEAAAPEEGTAEDEARDDGLGAETGTSEPVPRRGTVHVYVEEEPDDVVIRVEDNGPGVPDELYASIFEPFFTTRASGTGLGLATCQRIVDAHGGKLDVERSTKLGGALFRVRLPKREGRRPLDTKSEPGMPLLLEAQRSAARVE